MPKRKSKNPDKPTNADRDSKDRATQQHESVGPSPALNAATAPTTALTRVVGIGASAGGLEALQQFFAALSPNTGMSFVVITHQDPRHPGALHEILAKHSRLSFRPVEDGAPLEPNVVFVAGPEPVSLETGVLRKATPPTAVTTHPVDQFFRSLAAVYGGQAVAIVLSGTGSDGSLGVVEVKSAGGWALAQSTESALYPGMPASAAATRMVDEVLPPDQLAQRLSGPIGRASLATAAPPGDTMESFQRVLQQLRTKTGHDFTAYKKSTLWRRIERRMNVRGALSLRDYAILLEESSVEVETLFRELLIRVTTFFRDSETFEILGNELRRMFSSWDEQRPFRVWVPACATGEEAYSLAILIRELLLEMDKSIPVQIFATDLDLHAIDIARAGRYSSGITADVTKPRLDRFLVKEDSGYRISKEIRELIVFAPQNVIKDPPFTKLDLLSCRNLLIYLEPELQRHVIGLFGYALKPNGLLLLGSSESVAGFDDSFLSLDKKAKLFRRREVGAESPPEFSRPLAPMPHPALRGRPTLGLAETPPFALIAERALLTNVVPPSVLVNERGDIAYFHGRTGQFLEPAAGEPIANLFTMAREGLRLELPAAMRQAANEPEPSVRTGLQVKSNGGFISVRLTVRRVEDPGLARGMFVVTFELEPPLEEKLRAAGDQPKTEQQARLEGLEVELQHTRDNLQGTIEELETSNEELKSTNEELQSTNEELQSANEELETSREEMQSLNEELQTVNSELEERNRALSQANNDMQNLLNSTDIATVFLDDKLFIKRFTTQARKVFSLIDTDIGRPISDLAANVQYDRLLDDAREVLRSLVFSEREIRTKEGAWRLMRIMPYRTAENVIDGLVMTFIDVDHVKRREDAAEEARRFADLIIDGLPNGVMVVDNELRVVSANRAFYELFRTHSKHVLSEPLQAIADGVLDIQELVSGIGSMFERDLPDARIRVQTQGHRIGQKDLVIRARKLSQDGNKLPLVLIVVQELSPPEAS